MKKLIILSLTLVFHLSVMMAQDTIPFFNTCFSYPKIHKLVYHDVFHADTLEANYDSAQFHLMPNPARRSVVLECSNNAGNTPVTLKVCDMAGHEILVHKFQDTHLELDISAWPRGVYLFSLSSTAGVTVQKLVVE